MGKKIHKCCFDLTMKFLNQLNFNGKNNLLAFAQFLHLGLASEFKLLIITFFTFFCCNRKEASVKGVGTNHF
jgi:hypothetical protein